MPQHEPAVAAVIGPDGRPPRLEGSVWVSQDGRHFWNGVAWQPTGRPGFRPSPPLIAIAIAVVLVAGFAVFTLVMRSFQGEGVSNERIVSSSEIRFDYRRVSTCNDLTFEYRFFDLFGRQVGDIRDFTSRPIEGGVTAYLNISMDPSQPIDSSAVRFEADATCHD
jgi:hypothetical protein